MRKLLVTLFFTVTWSWQIEKFTCSKDYAPIVYWQQKGILIILRYIDTLYRWYVIQTVLTTLEKILGKKNPQMLVDLTGTMMGQIINF